MRTDASILQGAKRGKDLCGRGQGPRDTTSAAGYRPRARTRKMLACLVAWEMQHWGGSLALDRRPEGASRAIFHGSARMLKTR